MVNIESILFSIRSLYSLTVMVTGRDIWSQIEGQGHRMAFKILAQSKCHNLVER